MVRNNKGFSLIELALVLVIAGIVGTTAVVSIKSSLKNSERNENKNIIEAAVQSVINYAANSKRLPNAGAEYNSAVKRKRDRQKKDLYYIPDGTLTLTGYSDICSKASAAYTVRVCKNEACSSYQDYRDVAFMIMSGARNKNLQTDSNGGLYTVYFVDTPNKDDYSGDGTNPESYDDVVGFITLNQLKAEIGCQGTALDILEKKIPAGYDNATYTATLHGLNGVPFASGGDYSWCAESSESWVRTQLNTGTTIRTAGSCQTAGNFSQSNAAALSGNIDLSDGDNLNPAITVYVKDSSGNEANRKYILNVSPEQISDLQEAEEEGEPNPNATENPDINLNLFTMYKFNNNINSYSRNNGGHTDNWSRFATGALGRHLGFLIFNREGRACVWHDDKFHLFGDGQNNSFVGYFRMIIPDHSDLQGGMTFTVMQGSNDKDNSCGGYSDDLGYEGLNGRSVAIEFDLNSNTSGGTVFATENKLDFYPFNSIQSNADECCDHVAIVHSSKKVKSGNTYVSGTNKHYNSYINEPTGHVSYPWADTCRNDYWGMSHENGCYYENLDYSNSNSYNWMSTGDPFYVRFELVSGIDPASCSKCDPANIPASLRASHGDMTGCAEMNVWIAGSSSDSNTINILYNVGYKLSDYSTWRNVRTLYDCFPLFDEMKDVYVGFTAGANALQGHTFHIDTYGFKMQVHNN